MNRLKDDSGKEYELKPLYEWGGRITHVHPKEQVDNPIEYKEIGVYLKPVKKQKWEVEYGKTTDEFVIKLWDESTEEQEEAVKDCVEALMEHLFATVRPTPEGSKAILLDAINTARKELDK